MVYTIYVKDLSTEKVTLANIELTPEDAQEWIDSQMTIYVGEREYWFREGGDS